MEVEQASAIKADQYYAHDWLCLIISHVHVI